MAHAGARCGLFSPDVASALDAARLQAHGAALRAGLGPVDVAAVERRAEAKADATPCASRDLALAAGRVREAFQGYARLRTMQFPGRSGLWIADRAPIAPVRDGKAVAGPLWTLFETAAMTGGGATVGLIGSPGLVALITTADSGQAAAARLVLRDPGKTARPYLDPRRDDLASRVAPQWLSRAYLARSIGPAPRSLLPKGVKAGVLVVFPRDASDALAALDPREAARLDLIFPTRGGERVESALIEAGDFAAGRAFLTAGWARP